MIKDQSSTDTKYYIPVKIKPRRMVVMDHRLYGMLSFSACFFIFCSFLGTGYGDLPSDIIDSFFLPMACGAIPSIIVAWLIEKARVDAENKRLVQMRFDILNPVFVYIVEFFSMFARFSHATRKNFLSQKNNGDMENWEQWVKNFCTLWLEDDIYNCHYHIFCQYQKQLALKSKMFRRKHKQIQPLIFHLINAEIISLKEERALYNIYDIIISCFCEHCHPKDILEYIVPLKEAINTFDDYKCINHARYNRWIVLEREEL